MDRLDDDCALKPDEAALDRLCAAFPQPDEPMGEAWFMSDERRFYPELCGKLDDVETSVLEQALDEIASGTSCFGEMVEWRDWFRYLMPRLVHRAAQEPETTLAELLVTAFASQHPLGIEELYPGFDRDVLATLGRMSLSLALKGKVRFRRREELWCGSLSALSAGLAFHCKYLGEEELERLVVVLLSAQDQFRRAERLAWLVGAHGLLCGSRHSPSDAPTEGDPAVYWKWSHCLDMERLCPVGRVKPFIPSENGNLVIAKAEFMLAGDALLSWIASMEAVPELYETSWHLLDRAFDLYGSRTKTGGPPAMSSANAVAWGK